MNQKKDDIVILYHGFRNIGGGEKILINFFENIPNNFNVILIYLHENKVVHCLKANKKIKISLKGTLNLSKCDLNFKTIILSVGTFIIYSLNIYKILREVKPKYVYFHDNLNKLLSPILFLFLRFRSITYCHDVLKKHSLIDKVFSSIYVYIFFRVIAVSNIALNSISNNTKNNIKVFYPYPQGNLNKFTPKTFQSEFILITVGVLDYIKGQDIVIRSLARLNNNSIIIKYNIVGDGRQMAYLKELAINLGVAHLVTFHGAVYDQMHLDELYLNSHASVIPSRSESFGLSFIESLLRAIPVIASNIPVFEELNSKPYITYFESGDDDSLANSIEFVISNYKICCEHGLVIRKFQQVQKDANTILNSVNYLLD